MMKVPPALQPQALLIPPKPLTQHLRTIINTDPSLENLTFINTCLLDQIHTEAIPSSIYGVWLFLASQHSCDFVPAALRDPSCGVRKAGIQVARYQLFRGPRWKSHGWDLLGGAQGIEEIFDALPLSEVTPFAKAISAHAGSYHDRQVVMECIEELLSLLVDDANPWTSRSLSHLVSFLYAYCTADKVTEFLRAPKIPIPDTIYSHLFQFHTPLLQNIAIGTTRVPEGVRRNVLIICRESLIRSREPYVPLHLEDEMRSHMMPPGLLFGLDLSQVIKKEPDLQGVYKTRSGMESVLSLAIRDEKLPIQSFLAILTSALQLPLPKNPPNWLLQDLPKSVIEFWSIAHFGHATGYPQGLVRKFHARWNSGSVVPADDKTSLEQCLIQHVLRIKEFRLHPTRPKFTEFLLDLLKLVEIKGRLTFLQLLCKHAPTLNFDLTAWPPSEEEKQLIPVWDYEVLRLLTPDDSKTLFKRSLEIYHCDEFLPDPEARKNSWSLSWRKQCFLWVGWELAEKNAEFPVARRVIGQMKQKAMYAQENDQRLLWAKAAVDIAMRTESLDIYVDAVKWSKRYLRDHLVFPQILPKIISNGGSILSCKNELQLLKTPSKSDLLELAQKAHETVTDLLKTALLVLREPWAQKPMLGFKRMVPKMLSAVVENRIDAVRNLTNVNSISELELVEVLLDPLVSLFIDYERQANAESQTDLKDLGMHPFMPSVSCPDHPTPAELSFIDRLAKSRNEFWEGYRVRTNPHIVNLHAGFPRGLPIQHLLKGTSWLFHATKRPDEAPYLSSRINEAIFSPLETIMTVIPESIGEDDEGDYPVDSLRTAVDALIKDGEPADKVRHVLRIWEYYESLLKPHPLYLKLFRDWLSRHVYGGDTSEAAAIICPPVQDIKPKLSCVPLGPEVIEWDPQEGDDDTVNKVTGPNDDSDKPKEIPWNILCSRMEGQILDDYPRVATVRPEPIPKTPSLWYVYGGKLQAESRDDSSHVQDTLILSALLFLDSFTTTARLLRTQFPAHVEHPRYTPIYLADDFIARERNTDLNEMFRRRRLPQTLGRPMYVLQKCVKRIPSRILRDLISSFLDTLKADPQHPMYSHLLSCAFDLIGILLATDQPHLAIDIVLRVWKEFTSESSRHRKISPFKIGRILRPEQASEFMEKFARHVCEGLEAQQQQKQAGEKKTVIKVTTAKILAEVLAEADFLSQSTRMQILQKMFNFSRHIDIRKQIMASILTIVSVSDSPEPYKAFTSSALSAAGPNERSSTSEEEWIIAESKEGPLPSVAPKSERPILELVISKAATNIPSRFRSEYVQTVLLPLLDESTRQHFRWMAAMVARLGLSMSDLGIEQSAIGPFPPTVVNEILWKWTEHLPGTYLQNQHRNWALSYVHSAALTRITEELVRAADPALKHINVQDHWKEFAKYQRGRPALYTPSRLISHTLQAPSNDFTLDMVLDDFASRVEVIAKNPVRYNVSLGKYTVSPAYTLDILRDLRKSRVDNPSNRYTSTRPEIYDKTTELMMRVIDIVAKLRMEGWSRELAENYPVALPTVFEYEVLMLPSPSYNPAATESNTAVDIFNSAIVALIRKYVTDSVLLLKLDSLQTLLGEFFISGWPSCALCLGRVQHEEQCSEVEVCVRVTLARTCLDKWKKCDKLLDRDVLDMIEEWKRSDIGIVRQIGWEYE